MSTFNKDLIFKIDDKWFWRSDDTNLKTFNILSSETELLEKVKPFLKNNQVVVQAGGNCGMQVVKFAEFFQTVYTFEPDPINFYCLVNNLPYENVIKFQCCLGESHKMISMNPLKDEIGGFYVNENKGNIPTLRVDDLNLSSCDFIQLDVEGYQLFALNGAINTIQRFKPVISIELDWVERYNKSHRDIINFLTKLGYEKVDSYTSDHIYVYKELSFNL
jgi:FkbM family methyltransferase